MIVQEFIKCIVEHGNLFAVGVPDSQLRALCDYLIQQYGISNRHIIAANEGNCVAIAAGHYLATKEIPLVYLQNSGVGNIVNPIESLLKIYKIPCVFIIGWRGEPGTKDEPQHIYQGMSTIELLNVIDIPYFNLRKETTQDELQKITDSFRHYLSSGKCVAYIISKDALQNEDKQIYKNENKLCREKALEIILSVTENDIIVSSTGKISREIYEIRERRNQTHETDFLTVGSMGHCSSIAYGIALSKPDKKVWCIDGDGAFLMHMGAAAINGTAKLSNLIHIVLNNGAHESVGGMPTVANTIDLPGISISCGYEYAVSVNDEESLNTVLAKVQNENTSCFVEIKTSIASRSDLGRPKETPIENRDKFMKFLQQ